MKQTGVQVIATNRQARHRYFLTDTYEAGIVLTGSEVKSLREAKAQLTEAWASIDAGEAWLHGLHIAPYSHSQTYSGHRPDRDRKLLLHRNQIDRIGMKLQLERLSLVPTKLYLSDGKIKVELAVGKGKNVVDKRQDIKRRDSEREAARDIASARRRED
ncbi:MAG: SsrA-binding protein SmpB [Microthrixaceae bacterium]